MSRTLKAMLLAVLFVGTGLLTYQIYSWISKVGTDDTQPFLQLLTAIPFGVACSLRFMRPRRRFALAVALDCIIWTVAYRLGLGLAALNPYFGTALGGLVGALGVTAATGIGCRSLYSRRAMIGAALVGAVAGAPFGLILDRTEQENLILATSFPLWQVAVGMWIWVNSQPSKPAYETRIT